MKNAQVRSRSLVAGVLIRAGVQDTSGEEADWWERSLDKTNQQKLS